MEPTAYPPKKAKLIPGENDLETLYPDIASELVSEDPSKILATSTKKQAWKCSLCCDVWTTIPKSRVSTYDPEPGCPKCKSISTVKTRDKKIPLTSAIPELAAQAKDINDLEGITRSSHTNITWVCDKGHEYDMSPNKRVSGRGCPSCSFRVLDVTYNSVSAVRPDLVDQLVDESNADNMIANSKKKIEWFHFTDDGVKHKWMASPHDRCYSGYGCTVCTGRVVQSGVNDFKSQVLDTLGYKWSDENDFSPEDITMGSNKDIVLYCDNHNGDIYTMRDKAKYFTSGRRQCLDCIPTGDKFRSKPEREIHDLIQENFPDELVENNVRRFKSWGIYDIDIFVDKRIAIDFHGSYWHQEGVYKPVGYHERKREAMRRHGFAYLEVEEQDWTDDKEGVIEIILDFVRQEIKEPSTRVETISP